MSQPTRTLSNKPKYYDKLNTKQRQNWERNTRRIERNEELRRKYPQYRPSSNIIVVHLHYQTKLETVEQLIKKAEETKLYALDTESQHIQGQNQGALIQILMMHTANDSTMIFIEVNYLPRTTSLLYQKIEQLWSTIFSNNHKIISWGLYENEFEDFKHLELIQSGKKFEKINLQLKFQERKDEEEGVAHPEMESRDNVTEVDIHIDLSDDGNDKFYREIHGDNNKPNRSINEWSLQRAVEVTFEEIPRQKRDKKSLVMWN